MLPQPPANASYRPPLFLVFGYLDEIRNLSLTLPAFYLMACYGIQSVYGSATFAERRRCMRCQAPGTYTVSIAATTTGGTSDSGVRNAFTLPIT